jgi:hypothetical protein
MMATKGRRMVGNLEAFGDAVTGGVVGRAVEPKAGEGDGHTHETRCLNCGAELAGPFCHECGQHAHVHRTLSAFFHDFAHGVLHFEGKIFRTLPLLAWKPGELTRRYIDGQRASFVSPIALFLFSVFLMFAVMGFTGNMFGHMPAEASHDIAKDLSKDQQKLAILEQQRAAATGPAAAGLDEQISDVKSEMTALNALKESNIPPGAFNIDGSDGLPAWVASAIGKARQNPELLFFKLKTNAYKFSWALIPISVPFVWLLFPFSRRFRWYDHTVFVTYSLCFMMLLLSAGTLLALVSATLASLCWFVPPVHMYRQLRGTYGVGKWAATWRTFALTIFAFIAISLFVSLLVTVGAFD